jgi:hypothetical protein
MTDGYSAIRRGAFWQKLNKLVSPSTNLYGNLRANLQCGVFICGCHNAESLACQYFTQSPEFDRVEIDDQNQIIDSFE